MSENRIIKDTGRRPGEIFVQEELTASERRSIAAGGIYGEEYRTVKAMMVRNLDSVDRCEPIDRRAGGIFDLSENRVVRPGKTP